MEKIKRDKDMKREDIDLTHSENIAAVKWFDKRHVTLIGAFLEFCSMVSSVSWPMKGQGTIFFIACQQMIKEYNSGIRYVDLINQKTASYKVNRK